MFLRGVLIRLLGADTVGQMTTHIRAQLIILELRSNFSTQQRKPAHNENTQFYKSKLKFVYLNFNYTKKH